MESVTAVRRFVGGPLDGQVRGIQSHVRDFVIMVPAPFDWLGFEPPRQVVYSLRYYRVPGFRFAIPFFVHPDFTDVGDVIEAAGFAWADDQRKYAERCSMRPTWMKGYQW